MSKSLPKKSSFYFNLTFKLIIVLLFIWMVYKQVINKSELTDDWITQLINAYPTSKYLLFASIFLMPFNLLFESLKWKKLITLLEKHSTLKAYLSVLSGLTAGLITPARLGEYVGRLMYISPENNWKAVWSNFICSISQNLLTIIGGIAGLSLFLFYHMDLEKEIIYLSYSLGILFSIILLIIYYNLDRIYALAKKFRINNYLNRWFGEKTVFFSIKRSILNRVLLLATMRYMVFVCQYFLLLKFWGFDGPGILIIAAISLVFLIQSLLPLPPLIGLLARGEIAIFVFGIINSDTLPILAAAFSLWIINLAIPALIGLFVIMNVNVSKTMGYE